MGFLGTELICFDELQSISYGFTLSTNDFGLETVLFLLELI